MKIPNRFTINSQEITIEVVNTLPDQDFGEYCCLTDKIKIATHVKDDDGHSFKGRTNMEYSMA